MYILFALWVMMIKVISSKKDNKTLRPGQRNAEGTLVVNATQCQTNYSLSALRA